MPYSPNYPSTIAEVLDPPVRFKPATIEAVRQFARSKPWRGSVEERKTKFNAVHAALCATYGKTTKLLFSSIDGSDSGASCFMPFPDAIILSGRLSVVSYLHEFAHALGRDERGAVRWSASLFKRAFPRSFASCRHEGHMLRRGEPASG
jgi:hypothetical protein